MDATLLVALEENGDPGRGMTDQPFFFVSLYFSSTAGNTSVIRLSFVVYAWSLYVVTVLARLRFDTTLHTAEVLSSTVMLLRMQSSSLSDRGY